MLRGPESERFAAGERLGTAAPLVSLVAPVVFLVVAFVAAGTCTEIECASDRGSFAVLALVFAMPTFLPILYVPGDPPFGMLIGAAALTSIPLWVVAGRRLAARTVASARWDVPSWRGWWKAYLAATLAWVVVATAVWLVVT